VREGRVKPSERLWILGDVAVNEIVKYKKAIEKGAADKATRAEYKWWMEYARKAFCDAAPFWSPKLAAMAVRADVSIDDMRKNNVDPRQRLLEMYLQMRQRARLPKIVEGKSSLSVKQIEAKAVEKLRRGDARTRVSAIAAIYFAREFVSAGGLASYSPDVGDHRRASDVDGGEVPAEGDRRENERATRQSHAQRGTLRLKWDGPWEPLRRPYVRPNLPRLSWNPPVKRRLDLNFRLSV
jgi:hypothetical protein